MGSEWAADWRLLVSVFMALVGFGYGYNILMGKLAHRKEGYNSIFVAGGVLATLAGVALISWQAALLSVGAFAASGLPMVIGEMIRAIRAREEALERQKREVKEYEEFVQKYQERFKEWPTEKELDDEA